MVGHTVGVSTCVLGWEAAWGPFPRRQVNPPFVIIIIIISAVILIIIINLRFLILSVIIIEAIRKL